jgi:hypothetical protein
MRGLIEMPRGGSAVGRRGTIKQRFVKKITKDVPGPLETACWIYQDGSKKYGRFYWGPKPDGGNDNIDSHRASWRIFREDLGPIPDDDDGNPQQVLHKCDVKKCVNPDHLELGNHTINMAQKVERGGMQCMKGENNPRAQLTNEEAGHALWLAQQDRWAELWEYKPFLRLSDRSRGNLLGGETYSHITPSEAKRKPLPNDTRPI